VLIAEFSLWSPTDNKLSIVQTEKKGKALFPKPIHAEDPGERNGLPNANQGLSKAKSRHS